MNSAYRTIPILRFAVPYLAALSVTLFVMANTSLAFAATPNKGTFPNEGFLWMSSRKAYSGSLGVAFSAYAPDAMYAFSTIQSTTRGYSEMSRWPNGIAMYVNNWTGSWNANVSALVLFTTRYTNPNNQSPGQNYPLLAFSDYCAYWGTSYPCGQRPTVEIDTAWWNNASPASRQREIMHETGHSGGLYDYCAVDSIMNNGLSNCNGAKWTAVTGYLSTDRQGISNVYP